MDMDALIYYTFPKYIRLFLKLLTRFLNDQPDIIVANIITSNYICCINAFIKGKNDSCLLKNRVYISIPLNCVTP